MSNYDELLSDPLQFKQKSSKCMNLSMLCVTKKEGFSLLNIYHVKLLMLELSKQKGQHSDY